MVMVNDINIAAWTRGSRGDFLCTTPDGYNPCARADDRILGGRDGWQESPERLDGRAGRGFQVEREARRKLFDALHERRSLGRRNLGGSYGVVA